MEATSSSLTNAAHSVQPSLERLLSTDVLADIVGAPVSSVQVTPFSSPDGRSGSLLQSVQIDGSRRFVLKHVTAASDLVMQLTDDVHVRAMALWRDGILDRLPRVIRHGILACAHDGDGWAFLLKDFSGYLLPPDEERLNERVNAALLDALAALHAIFWEDHSNALAHESLCTLMARAASISPPKIRPYAREYPFLQTVLEGWELFPSVVSGHVADLVNALHHDISPLCAALERYPQTLIHGDWHHGNLGFIEEPEPRVIALDWSVTSIGPPAIDLAEYLAIGSMRLPGTKDEAIASYRRSLCIHLGARFEDSWWTPQLELALLGEFVRLGWNKALTALQDPDATVRHRERAEINWWAEHAILGARWL